MFVALLPSETAVIPSGEIQLEGVSVALYPQADPEAVWLFAAPEVTYDPAGGSSVLYAIEDGRRTVGGETDFTLASERVEIDRSDNLHGELIFAYLVETGECLTMSASGERRVVIDQQRGRFEVPLLRIDGPAWGEDNRWERVSASFDLTDFTAGGPGTTTVNEFETGAAQSGQTRRTPCERS